VRSLGGQFGIELDLLALFEVGATNTLNVEEHVLVVVEIAVVSRGEIVAAGVLGEIDVLYATATECTVDSGTTLLNVTVLRELIATFYVDSFDGACSAVGCRNSE
jgi:hypothetical protein